ncbi:alpha-galactosidase [Parabacteroides sp. PF5-9]|uniref:alpha-galactosidase n=1 Tax=Parabacteroides sp. PF5-9 TaxID=1742404 RepID=UPI002477173C|nr:alpha-galactosidase [Parabacteroides sp. PF5-9]MDH6358521.1 alpha-galactosidase [Parabacteroides sp. PF5-9]
MKKVVIRFWGLIIGLLLIPFQGNTIQFRFVEGRCVVELRNDSLFLENDLIKRSWKWNGGHLVSAGLCDKKNDIHWEVNNNKPDLLLPGEKDMGVEALIDAEIIEPSLQSVKHVQVAIHYKLGTLEIKRLFKLYDAVPAIACEFFIRGKASQNWVRSLSHAADLQNIEVLTSNTEGGKVPTLDHLSLSGKHWKIEAVEFFDITDRFNTLVRPVHALSYRDCIYRGNLLFAENTEKGAGFFMLKEAPTSNVQLHYPNGDFLTNNGSFQMIGIGVDSIDLKPDEWTKTYSYATGVFRSNEFEKRAALRSYQMQLRPFLADRDEMVMLNTWGDRGQDTRVNETFCLNELELASQLGITHFQIDDGWQAGRSANSAFGGSYKNIWDNPNYWTPDPDRFPNGLAPIVKRGKELGIEVCLWFNPSIQHDYADWEKDADALISLYNTYGIRTFKIDGTAIPNKLSENRLRSLYNRVMEATGWKAVLNLDATAGRRGGYFFFNAYGNIFLENRYTDWQNYYPYWTLRNLWMLSKYVPPQMLQIEFLNKWRNTEKYGDDRFAPSQYAFDYLFAITMAAQPLAWFEAANLPQEAFITGELIKTYKTIQHDLHQGYILPIGEEPSGRSWSGFQSVKENSGYFLIFRENNEQTVCKIPTYLKAYQSIRLTHLAGSGDSFETKTDANGEISFSLPEVNSFGLYRYVVNSQQ